LAALFTPWAGAAGAAGAVPRCVTLLDCLPKDIPPPRRLAASAFMPPKAIANVKTTTDHFMIAPKNL
jgi:hypothetical protein